MATYTLTPVYLTIYASDARTVIRRTTHQTRRQAVRSLYDYERRHGRHPNAITCGEPAPGATAAEWDAWRLAQGYAGR